MQTQPVLILGAGINGCAIARELAVNGVPVVMVDIGDIGSGATFGSSRLIHGGLRYLEFGEFDLVRESLAERARLVRLAPDFVRRLELVIPVERRSGGLFASTARFVGCERLASRFACRSRGLWLVRLGLGFYDRYAGDPNWPRHCVQRSGSSTTVDVDPRRFPWLCSYWDAQLPFPERFLQALLADGKQASTEHGSRFEVFTYHQALRHGPEVQVVSLSDGAEITRLHPAAVVNATGAWVDRTLQAIRIDGPPLMGPTKGSHLVTFHEGLATALHGRGVYGEAADGRPVFVLPLTGGATLIGTTDIPFDDDPAAAIAGGDELDYLLAAVGSFFPQLGLTRDDIDFHYAGVRPLPRVDATSPAGITRRHRLHEHHDAEIPTCSVIGGKLTTCRSLAESTVDTLLKRLGKPRIASTRDRPIPAGRHAIGWTPAQDGAAAVPCLDGTLIPLDVARGVIQHEYVRQLDDLVERRLMLLFQRRLTRQCLAQLATLLADAGLLPAGNIPTQVERTIARLREHYGKLVHGG